MRLFVCHVCRRTFSASDAHCTNCVFPTCDECRGPHLVACRERMAEEAWEAEKAEWEEWDRLQHERETSRWLEGA